MPVSLSTVVHDVAQTGFGKGTNELYDKARPSYPSDALSAIRASLTSAPPFNILEIGSGTGIFTRAFLRHQEFSSAVHELRAIEPSEGMREHFSRTINDPRVSVNEGTFHQTHVPDEWADLIVVAQAFHWCHPDYNKAMTEFARALAPHGRAIFIWNLEGLHFPPPDIDILKEFIDPDGKTAWVHQVRQVVESFELGTPQFRLGLWRKTFQTPSYLQHFQPPQELVFQHIVQGTKQSVIERALSKSYISTRSESQKDQISKDLTSIIERGDDKVWIDEREGTFVYPYVNTVIIMQKK